MKIASFRDLYIAELQELRSVTVQVGQALAEMADAASDSDLEKVLTQQHKDIQAETQQVDEILLRHKVPVDPHKDQAMEALIKEMSKMLSIVDGEDLRDAALIGSMQRLEHYQIAAYGTAAALAGQLELRNDEKTLHAAVQQKKRVDSRLSKLALTKVNPTARAA